MNDDDLRNAIEAGEALKNVPGFSDLLAILATNGEVIKPGAFFDRDTATKLNALLLAKKTEEHIAADDQAKISDAMQGFLSHMIPEITDDIERMSSMLIAEGLPDPREVGWPVLALMVGCDRDAFMEDIYESAIAWISRRKIESAIVNLNELADERELAADTAKNLLFRTNQSDSEQQDSPKNSPTNANEDPDGPIEPNHWVINGVKHEANLPPTAFKLAKYVWESRNHCASFNDISEHVFEDALIEASNIQDHQKHVNKFLTVYAMKMSTSSRRRTTSIQRESPVNLH
jgi:hypothetical protein